MLSRRGDRKMKRLLLFFVSASVITTAFAADKVVRLGSTTSVKASGLLALIAPRFEKDTGYKLDTFATGSGKAMQLARDGKFDILIVHAPASEKKLIADGFATKRIPFMKNYFLIAGPAADPAHIKGQPDVYEALKRIAATKSMFISRADDSGTHKKELSLWHTTRIDPVGSWYYESGLGMGKALELANKESAYILVDDGTWLANKKGMSLVLLTEDHTHLANTYSVVTLNSQRIKHLNQAGATAFKDWLLSSRGKDIIRGMKRNGEPMFSLVKN